MAAMVGLGVGIDYALFLLSRHREYLAAGVPVAESVGRSLATAGQAVVFAGGTVVVAILGLAVAGLPFVSAAGVGISAVVLVMVLAAITLLPALLGLAGHRLRTRRLLLRLRRGGATGPGPTPRCCGGPAGVRTSRGTPRRTPSAARCCSSRSPRPSSPCGWDCPTRAATRRRAPSGGPTTWSPRASGPAPTGRMVVAVDVSRDRSVVEPLVSALAADPGIASVAAAPVDATSDVAVIIAQPTTDTAGRRDRTRHSTGCAARCCPPRWRAARRPRTSAATPPPCPTSASASQERLPIFLVAVVAMSFLLLMVLFRSVLVPLKAAVLNLLSVAAAYGVLVMVFQWGWAASLIGLESTVPIISFIPLFMFAILFGLSMDYEVFLLSRVREEYLRTGDNGYAVVRGIGGHRADDLVRCRDHGVGLRRLRPRRRPRPEDARPRPGDRGRSSTRPWCASCWCPRP